MFRFTIIWEKVIVIIEEGWPSGYHGSLGGSGQVRSGGDTEAEVGGF
jgi:hypothetical protein